MKRFLLSCVMAVAAASVASANSLCTSNTMAYYIATYVDQTTACQVGDVLFFGFGYSATYAGATGPTSSQVTVTADASSTSQPALIFSSSGWNVSGTATLASPLYIDSNITFTAAAIDMLPIISGATLDIAGQYAVSGQGVANIGETVLLDGGSAGSLGLAVDSNAGPFTDDKSFSPASFVRVSKDLIVTVPRPITGSVSGSASITSFREGFSTSSTPEPVSMVLFGSGLVGLALLRRKRG